MPKGASKKSTVKIQLGSETAQMLEGITRNGLIGPGECMMVHIKSPGTPVNLELDADQAIHLNEQVREALVRSKAISQEDSDKVGAALREKRQTKPKKKKTNR